MNSSDLAPETRHLCLFAKHWMAGKVKTRLAADIGFPQAAQLHRIFVKHLTETLHPSPSTGDFARPLLATSPDAAVNDVSAACPNWLVTGQGPGDLGQRLQQLFRDQLSGSGSGLLAGSGRWLVIGADCPDLPMSTIQTAWRQLRTVDVVLGPATDGGYYLLGLRGPWQVWMSELFTDIPWSGPDVAAVTRRRIRGADKQLAELESRDDVDTLPDLKRLIARLNSNTAAASDRKLLAAIAQVVPETVAAELRLVAD